VCLPVPNALSCAYHARHQVADAIRRNSVVGSSAIGITAAFGLALGAQKLQDEATFEEVCSCGDPSARARPHAPLQSASQLAGQSEPRRIFCLHQQLRSGPEFGWGS
jgi:hypothetical protein